MSVKQRGTQLLFISHGAGTGLSEGTQNVETDWFIVEPRDDHDALMRQVQSLRKAGRTVRRLIVTPYEGRCQCGREATGTTPQGTPECSDPYCDAAIDNEREAHHGP